jgi:predicted ATPase
VISGCSGGGKSTLLTELDRRGYATVEEPGRRIVREELERDGSVLPWKDLEAFLLRALALAFEDRAEARHHDGWVFFDRGLVDAAAGLERATGKPARAWLSASDRYHRRAFLTPPWPEIYVADQERRQDLIEAIAEYDHLLKVFPALGYHVTLLPKVGVTERADFVLHTLANS